MDFRDIWGMDVTVGRVCIKSKNKNEDNLEWSYSEEAEKLILP